MSIADSVRSQYEQHPYPAWETLPAPVISKVERDCLYAGCGTGREVLYDALCFPRSRFVAIDVSVASLRYAIAKATELGVSNVRFVEQDLLCVQESSDRYDFIKSTGVLHHLESPIAGLKALKVALKPSGEIKFSVYSKSARRFILEAIELRKQMGFPPNDEGISEFRRYLKGLPEGNPLRSVLASPDFGSIAGTRDLLFNVCEHNFSIPDLVRMVADADLEIIKWGPSASVEKFLSMGYSNLLDWRAWHAAEQHRPGLFANGMYSLTVAHPDVIRTVPRS